MSSRRYHLKKAFNNLLLSYIIMLFLPIIFIIFLYHQTYQTTVTNCINSSLSLLQNTQSYITERLNTLDNIALKFSFDPAITNAFEINKPVPGDSDVYQISKLNKYFNNKLDNNLNYFLRYQLLFKNNEVIYFNDGVNFGIKSYSNHTTNHLNLSYEQWYHQTFNTSHRNLLTNQLVKLSNATVDAITYNFPIKDSRSDNIEGALQFIIPKNTLLPLPRNQEDEGGYYLLDQQGQLIASTMDYTLISPYISEMSQPSGYLKITQDNQHHFIVYTKNTDTCLTLAAIYSETFVLSPAKNIRLTALLALIICSIVEGLLMLWITWRNAIPIHNFSKNLTLLLSNDTQPLDLVSLPVNEYEALHKGILTLQETKHSITSINREKFKLQKKIFLDQLLEGRYKSDEDILQTSRSIGIHLSSTVHYLISFKTSQLSNFQKQMEYFVENHLSDSFIIHSFEKDILILIIFFSNTDSNKYTLSTLMGEFLLSNTLSECNQVGISKSHTALADIPLAYKQSIYCLRFAAKNQLVIYYEDIVSDFDLPFYPEEIKNLLCSATKLRESDTIHTLFAKIRIQNLVNRHLSSTMEQILIANIELTLFKLYEEILSIDAVDALLKDLSKLSAIADLLDRLEQEFITLAHRNEEKRSERNRQLCALIAEYIKANYTSPELCLASIAAHFELSESYFSQFYKESFGETFSVSLETIRLNKAKELILESSLEIEKIAQQIGYTNSTTFRRAFKRCTGLSPSSFKLERKS